MTLAFSGLSYDSNCIYLFWKSFWYDLSVPFGCISVLPCDYVGQITDAGSVMTVLKLNSICYRDIKQCCFSPLYTSWPRSSVHATDNRPWPMAFTSPRDFEATSRMFPAKDSKLMSEVSKPCSVSCRSSKFLSGCMKAVDVQKVL